MVYITADSTCDLPQDRVAKHGISIQPLTVVLNAGEYLDGVDIQPDAIYANFDATHTLPKTAAVTPDAYEETFRRLTAGGNTVVHLNLSEKMSSSYNNACLAAREVPGVEVVDTANLSTGSGLLVLEAAEMAEQGMPAEAIAQRLRQRTALVDASFIVANLNYLHAGGRCSSVAKLGANLLGLKPCIEVRQGQMGVGTKYRGSMEKCLRTYVQQRLQANAHSIDPHRVFITHSGISDERWGSMAAEIACSIVPFEDVIINHAGCTICSHCGPDTIGVLYMHKES